MLNLNLYSQFSKKENSTKQPTLVTAKLVQGILKEPCSIMNPVITIERLPNDAMPFQYTYAKWVEASRYYFIEDWVWANGLWEVHMKEDVLATFKTEIGAKSEYILRTDDATSNFNGAISDSAYPATTDFDIDQVTFSPPTQFVQSVANGTYVVGIVSGDNADAVGAITYYAMTSSQFGTLKDVLFGQSGIESMDLWDIVNNVWKVADMSEEIFKTMYNPYQYIISCTWFPIETTAFVGTDIPNATETQIKIGWWGFNISGKRLTQQLGGFNDSVEMLPIHPQAPTRGKYLNYAPYTKYTLYGKFGSIPIDTTYLEIGSYMVNYYTVDYVTGQCLFQVFVAPNSDGTGRKLIYKTEFLIGVPIQIAQIGRDYLGMGVNAIEAGKSAGTGAVMGAITGGTFGAIAGAITSAGGAIYNTIDSSMPQFHTSGVNGSFIETELTSMLIAIHYVVVDEDIHHIGRPLCEVKQINTLSGFILCAEGDIDMDAYDNERKEIRNYLTTGFFWE